MRKIMSKLMSLAMIIAMVLVMGVPVLAADGDQTPAAEAKLTINSQQVGAEYSVYQIMTAEKLSSDSELYKYTLTDGFKNAFPLTIDSTTYVLNGNNEICLNDTDKTPVTGIGLGYDKTTYNRTSDVAKLAAALEKYATENNVQSIKTITFDEAGAKSETLPIGYYVVKQTKVPEKDAQNGYVASKAVLVNLTADKDVTTKDDTEKLDKVITGLNKDTSQSVDENTAQIGDLINYKVTTYIPTYGADVDKTSLKFWLYDTFSEGITYNNDVKVYLSATEGGTDTSLKEGEDYDTEKKVGSEVTFEVNLTPDTVYKNQGKYVTLVYSGTLNEHAKVNASEGNPNTIELSYTNAPGNGESHLEDTVKTYTFGLGIKKVDKATGEELDGAKFRLSKDSETVKLIREDENTYRVAKDGERDTVEEIEVNSKTSGNPVIKGLGEGTYTLTETQTPDKYSKVDDITVTVAAKRGADGKLTGAADITIKGGQLQNEDGTLSNGETTVNDGNININIYVEDTKGISLPETGSKTAMYCLIGGALLVVLGGLYLGLTSRKKNI